MSQERGRLLGDVGAERFGEWTWLAHERGSRLGRFIRDISRLAECVGVGTDGATH